MPPKPGTSIVDVARLAGVSKSTVSLVINEPRRVTPAKREKVLKAIEALNFTPRSDKRRGRKEGGASHARRQVALLFPDPHSRGSSTPLGGSLVHLLEEALDAAGFQLVVTHLRDRDRLPRCLENGSVQGVVIRSGDLPAPTRISLERFPCVTVLGAEGARDLGDMVRVDNFRLGEMAARMLLGLGRRRLVQVEHYTGAVRNTSWAERFEGFRHAAASEGAPCSAWVFGPDTDWPACAVRKYFESATERPDGLFGRGEGLMEALEMEGVRIGRDFDWVRTVPEGPWNVPFARRSHVMDIDMAGIAKTAVELLLKRMEHPEAPRQITMIAPQPPLRD